MLVALGSNFLLEDLDGSKAQHRYPGRKEAPASHIPAFKQYKRFLLQKMRKLWNSHIHLHQIALQNNQVSCPESCGKPCGPMRCETVALPEGTKFLQNSKASCRILACLLASSSAAYTARLTSQVAFSHSDRYVCRSVAETFSGDESLRQESWCLERHQSQSMPICATQTFAVQVYSRPRTLAESGAIAVLDKLSTRCPCCLGPQFKQRVNCQSPQACTIRQRAGDLFCE